jgi:glycosyltransferase involved in cell wall biosynthesis
VTISIGLVANVYNEANALPGWLETHLPFFDDVRVLHTGPNGSYSDDGTMEILKKWGIPVEMCSIDEGFGAVRTRAIHMSPCDYVMLLDVDERFYPIQRNMTCSGYSTPQHEVDWILQSYDFRGVNLPNWENVDRLGSRLSVDVGALYDQGTYLRNILELDRPDVVCTIRRHWHDLNIYFDSDTRMHERLVGMEKVYTANMTMGPFFDHFHFIFKRMEVEQRAHDIAIYDALNRGERPPTWKEFKS